MTSGDHPARHRVERRRIALRLQRFADRLDALADTAELMGDADGAERFRSHASSQRLRAMAWLDG